MSNNILTKMIVFILGSMLFVSFANATEKVTNAKITDIELGVFSQEADYRIIFLNLNKEVISACSKTASTGKIVIYTTVGNFDSSNPHYNMYLNAKLAFTGNYLVDIEFQTNCFREYNHVEIINIRKE